MTVLDKSKFNNTNNSPVSNQYQKKLSNWLDKSIQLGYIELIWFIQCPIHLYHSYHSYHLYHLYFIPFIPMSDRYFGTTSFQLISWIVKLLLPCSIFRIFFVSTMQTTKLMPLWNPNRFGFSLRTKMRKKFYRVRELIYFFYPLFRKLNSNSEPGVRGYLRQLRIFVRVSPLLFSPIFLWLPCYWTLFCFLHNQLKRN